MIKIKHTIQRDGIFYINLRLSEKNKTFRQSLKTDSIRCCRLIMIKITEQIQITKSEGKTLNTDKLKGIISCILSNHLRKIEENTKAVLEPMGVKAQKLNEQYQRVTSNDRYHNHNSQELGYSAVRPLPSFTEFIVKDFDVPVNDYSDFREWDEEENEYLVPDEWMFLEHEPDYIAYQSMIEGLRVQTARLKHLLLVGDLEGADKVLQRIITAFRNDEIKPQTNKEPLTPYFSELIDPYLGQLKLKIDGIREYKRHMNFFNCSFAGHRVANITRKMLDDAMELFINTPLKNIPKQRQMKTNYKYNNWKIQERVNVASNDLDPLFLPSTTYTESPLKVIKDFFIYLVRKNILEKNPQKDMIFKAKEAKYEGGSRGKFTDTQANKILQHCISDLSNELNWAIILMAYTGARNGEILQLRKSDVFKLDDSDVLVIRIHEEAGSTKNKYSNRIIPVPQNVINLGFIDFCHKCQGTVLFKKSVDNLSSYYRKLRKILDIKEVSQSYGILDLYSFRHNLQTALEMESIHDSVINYITGHSNRGVGGETLFRYWCR